MPSLSYYRAMPDRYQTGFSLFIEEGEELVEVPEARHLIFRTEDEAYEFAKELERPEPEEDR